jgi:hypothetical protein
MRVNAKCQTFVPSPTRALWGSRREAPSPEAERFGIRSPNGNEDMLETRQSQYLH